MHTPHTLSATLHAVIEAALQGGAPLPDRARTAAQAVQAWSEDPARTLPERAAATDARSVLEHTALEHDPATTADAWDAHYGANILGLTLLPEAQDTPAARALVACGADAAQNALHPHLQELL